MITVFYDGACGLCSKEIGHYIKIAPKGVFNWQDITKSAETLKANGVSLEQGLMFLHATDETGEMYVGVDAFILIWSQLKRWRVLGTIAALPIIRPCANAAYRAFARWRFKRLGYHKICDSGNAP